MVSLLPGEKRCVGALSFSSNLCKDKKLLKLLNIPFESWSIGYPRFKWACEPNFYCIISYLFQDKARALAISAPCLRLFQHLFKFRQHDLAGKDLTSVDSCKNVEIVESHFIETFLTLMLKLSLDDFKPIFYRLFNLSYSGEYRTTRG